MLVHRQSFWEAADHTLWKTKGAFLCASSLVQEYKYPHKLPLPGPKQDQQTNMATQIVAACGIISRPIGALRDNSSAHSRSLSLCTRKFALNHQKPEAGRPAVGRCAFAENYSHFTAAQEPYTHHTAPHNSSAALKVTKGRCCYCFQQRLTHDTFIPGTQRQPHPAPARCRRLRRTRPAIQACGTRPQRPDLHVSSSQAAHLRSWSQAARSSTRTSRLLLNCR